MLGFCCWSPVWCSQFYLKWKKRRLFKLKLFVDLIVKCALFIIVFHTKVHFLCSFQHYTYISLLWYLWAILLPLSRVWHQIVDKEPGIHWLTPLARNLSRSLASLKFLPVNWLLLLQLYQTYLKNWMTRTILIPNWTTPYQLDPQWWIVLLLHKDQHLILAQCALQWNPTILWNQTIQDKPIPTPNFPNPYRFVKFLSFQ